MERRILHVDMDAFFASVEQVRDPSLRGKALIIGGTKEDTRGVVSTASYEAREYGVHSGMALARAKRLCPHGVFMRGSFEHYKEASDSIREVLEGVSPLMQMASIDEAYIDVSGSQRLFGGDDAIAAYIKSEIHARTQLPCTVGIAPNKLVAKVASNEGKPDGYTRVGANEARDFLRPLPIGKLPGVGPKTRDSLVAQGIKTVGDLAELPLSEVLRLFGQGGYGMQRAARGISVSPVQTERVPKSIGRETTFREDLSDWEQIERVLHYLTERAMYSLRQEGLEAKRVTLKVRYADFSTHTFARTFDTPTSLDTEVVAALFELAPKGKERAARVRLIGVSLSQLCRNQHQIPLFDAEAGEKWRQALNGVDAVRRRHGFQALRSGHSMSLGRDVKLSTPSLSR